MRLAVIHGAAMSRGGRGGAANSDSGISGATRLMHFLGASWRGGAVGACNVSQAVRGLSRYRPVDVVGVDVCPPNTVRGHVGQSSPLRLMIASSI